MTENRPTEERGELRQDRRGPPRTPLWVKILGVIALVGIILATATLVLGIKHGPGLHGASLGVGVRRSIDDGRMVTAAAHVVAQRADRVVNGAAAQA